jgi:hypothetical protein
VRLDALFSMTDAEFRDTDVHLHEAMARYACQWLDARGALWTFYRAWRDAISADAGEASAAAGARAFERTTGATPAQATDAWVSWLRRL